MTSAQSTIMNFSLKEAVENKRKGNRDNAMNDVEGAGRPPAKRPKNNVLPTNIHQEIADKELVAPKLFAFLLKRTKEVQPDYNPPPFLTTPHDLRVMTEMVDIIYDRDLEFEEKKVSNAFVTEVYFLDQPRYL